MEKCLIPTTESEVTTAVYSSILIADNEVAVKDNHDVLKYILSIDLESSEEKKGHTKLALHVPIVQYKSRYSSFQKKFDLAITPDCSVEHHTDRWGKWPGEKDFVSKNFRYYVEAIELDKCSAMRFNIKFYVRFPNFGQNSSSSWYGMRGKFITEKQYLTLEEAAASLQFTTIQTEYHSVSKTFIENLLKFLNENTDMNGVEIRTPNNEPLKEFLTVKRNAASKKLMSLKINSRIISYDSFSKEFICRPNKEKILEKSEFNSEECKNIIKEANVHIMFDPTSRYSDGSDFTYELTLISYDRPKDPKYYDKTGKTVFHCIEDENLFDIIKAFREINIPIGITGLKRLLGIYRRTERLVGTINENFPEDVLLAEIGEEGFKL